MSKFEYILGWIAAAGSVAAVIGILILSAIDGWNGIIIKLAWMPFVFLWGMRQISIYKRQKIAREQYLERQKNWRG